jgi:hypothetical protein
MGIKSKKTYYAFLPFFEADYGAFRDTQLHMVVPFSFNATKGQPSYYGPGIVELGVKYRIIHETNAMPQIGVFPLVELPTGDPDKGLGKGKTQLFIPIWLQKSWGRKHHQWKTYGGGGYWINPGLHNKNYWFCGWVIQRDICKDCWSGLELFYQTKTKINEHESFGFNIGGAIPIHKNWQVLYSFGNQTGLGQFLYCMTLYHTW